MFLFPLRTFVLAAIALLSTGSAVRAQVPCSYEVTAVIQGPDCGIFGPPAIQACGLNERGDVVGNVCDCQGEDEEAWLWTQRQGFSLLTMPDGATNSTAMDINDAGFMTGYVESTADGLGRLAFLHDGVSVTTFKPFEGGTYTEGLAINNNLQIVGNWGNQLVGNPPFEAFIWQDGVMRSLADDLGTSNSEANDINEAGMVTGFMGTNPGVDGSAFIWHEGRVTKLPIPRGGFSAKGNGINNHGDVVGTSWVFDAETGDTVRRATIWQAETVTVIEPPPGFAESYGFAINDAGVATVSFSLPATYFVWYDGRAVPIAESVPEGFDTGWLPAINNSGQLITDGHPPGGGRSSLLLTPVIVVGDLDHDCAVGATDLIALLGQWGQVDSPADLNGDGTVNSPDLIILLGNWG